MKFSTAAVLILIINSREKLAENYVKTVNRSSTFQTSFESRFTCFNEDFPIDKVNAEKDSACENDTDVSDYSSREISKTDQLPRDYLHESCVLPQISENHPFISVSEFEGIDKLNTTSKNATLIAVVSSRNRSSSLRIVSTFPDDFPNWLTIILADERDQL